MRRFGYPKKKKPVKKKAHAYSILQPDASYCYLCNLLYGDDVPQKTEEHHVFFGTALRSKSEAMGMKVRLCTRHHRTGPDAVHRNADMARRLQKIAQEQWEQEHSREEWMKIFGRNFLDDETGLSRAEEILWSFKSNYPNLASRMVEYKAMPESNHEIVLKLNTGKIMIYSDRLNAFRIWRGDNAADGKA